MSASIRRWIRTAPRRSVSRRAAFYAHDVVDFGFLDLVRLGVVAPDDPNVSTSLAPSARRFGRQLHGAGRRCPTATSTSTGTTTTITARATPTAAAGPPTAPIDSDGSGRFFPGSAGNTRSPTAVRPPVYLQSMADAANDGYFVPEQVWDRSGRCLFHGRPADRQRRSSELGRGPIPASRPVDRRRFQSRHAVRRQGEVSRRGADPRRRRQVHRRRRREHKQRRRDPDLHLQRDGARRAGPGTAATERSARSASAWTSPAARPPAARRSSFRTATARAPRNGAGDSRPAS